MNNLTLYRRVCTLKDYLENSEFEEFTAKQIQQANDYISQVFKVLDRRKP